MRNPDNLAAWRWWGTILGLALLCGSAALVLALGSTAQPASAEDGPPPVPDAAQANLGSAQPSDKFIQSFQQQLSQQLQNALDQSGKDQESRLQGLAQQQSALQSQITTLQQALDANRSSVPGGSTEGSMPNVHSRTAPEGEAGALLRAESLNPRGSTSTWRGGTEPPTEPSPAPADLDSYGLGAKSPRSANVAPHGFIEGRMLNGVVTIVGGPDRESVIALTGPYHSANGFESRLDGCFALVQGHPEIAAGRIDFKLSRLTCNFPDGASRTWDTAGWLVDADGIRGIRATIVENLGRKAAVAAAGGAVAGVGQRLSQEQYLVSSASTASGAIGTSSSFAGAAASDALGGAASGAANAAAQSLGDYYTLFAPSLQVGGGTAVTVVLANDLRVPRSGSQLTPTFAATP